MVLEDYVNAGYPAIVVNTVEEERVKKEFKSIAQKTKTQYEYWTLTSGIISGENKIDCSPLSVAQQGIRDLESEYRETGRIFLVIDFHPYIKTPEVWRGLKDAFLRAKSMGVTFVFISAKFEVPVELQREVICTDFVLPKKKELEELLIGLADFNKVPVPENKNDVLEAALGLTMNEAENAFAMSISKTGIFDPKIICQVKETIICNGGLLEFKNSDETLSSIGGLKNFTTWAEKRFEAYSEEAVDYGLPYPKGVLLVGIPGCGKSLTAKALANMWNKPLLRLDIGKLFGGIVGDTESNTRRALQIAEAMAPAILWIDEIEKGLSGIQSSGKTDSGVTSRMFGTLLTWLQEKEAPVFVMATANNISQLPPEFLRKGRFDEIFFVDLPSLEERKDIFEIQLKKHKRNVEDFDIDVLAENSDSYTGAEIEEAVITSMYNAYYDGKREPSTEDIIFAMKSITPMAKGIMQEQINNLRDWSEKSCISKANGIKTEVVENGSYRRIIRKQEED